MRAGPRASPQDRRYRSGREAELRKAEREMETIRQDVRLGKATVPLLEMVEEATAKVQRLRAELGAEPKAKAIVKILPGLVERYARDLRATLGRDTDRARLMLSRLLGDVILRPEKDDLWAEVRRNSRVLVDGVRYVDAVGAGRAVHPVSGIAIRVA
jgi:hypothetical protein